MSNQPEITFHQPSLEYDILRLLFTAHKLTTGQYQYHNWFVVPSTTHTSKRSGDPAARERRGPANLIIFPQLEYSPNFWIQSQTSVTPTTPPVASTSLVQSVANLLSPTWSPDSYLGYHQLQDTWQELAKEFWPTFFTILPHYQSRLKSINVYPTQFGTTKSFSLLSDKTTALHIYLRTDQGISSLIDGIVSGTTRGHLQTRLNLTWSETEVAKDTLLLITPLSQYTPDYRSTLHATRTKSSSLQAQSLTYLKSLGLDNSNQWTLDDHTISYHSQPLQNLTKAEHLILTTLIQTPSHSLSQHDLASALYPNPDKFSLWGLAKAIQRLRNKLKANNLPEHLIQTDRNHGYSLYSSPTITKPDDLIF